MKCNKLIIYIQWIAIIVLAICQFVRVEPYIVWSSETFIGVFVSLMGIAVAVIIGYQAVSSHEIKNELKEQQRRNENLQKESKEFQDKIERLINDINTNLNTHIKSVDDKVTSLEKHSDTILVSTQESVSILNALIMENTKNLLQRYPLDTFTKMHEALFFSLEYESSNAEFIFDKLRQYGSEIHTHTFGGSFTINENGVYCCNPPYTGKSLKEVVDTEYLPPIKDIEDKIKKHKRFSSISHDYKMLMNGFYDRIDLCVSRQYPNDASELDKPL